MNTAIGLNEEEAAWNPWAHPITNKLTVDEVREAIETGRALREDRATL
jgi:hypothetical protein